MWGQPEGKRVSITHFMCTKCPSQVVLQKQELLSWMPRVREGAAEEETPVSDPALLQLGGGFAFLCSKSNVLGDLGGSCASWGKSPPIAAVSARG